MPIDQTLIRSFREDGVVIAHGILAEADLRPVIDEIDAYVDRRAGELRDEGRISELHADAPFARRIGLLYAQCPDIVDGLDIMRLRGRAMFDFLHNQRLLDAVETLIGPEITCSPIQHLRAKVPTRLGDGTHEMAPWHQDAGVTLEEADDSDIVTCWIPLVDATRENGCMEVMPGAARHGHLQHVSLGGTTIRPDLLPAIQPVAAACPVGGVVFMSKLTPHRGLPNLSDGVRWTIDLRFQKTGTATGRPFHPDFAVRSQRHGVVTRDYADWCRRWIEALESSKGRQIHRVAAYRA